MTNDGLTSIISDYSPEETMKRVEDLISE